jgi:hypothetical protein
MEGHHIRIAGGPAAISLKIELDGKPLNWVQSIHIHADANDYEHRMVYVSLTLCAGVLEMDTEAMVVLSAPFQVVPKVESADDVEQLAINQMIRDGAANSANSARDVETNRTG